MLSIYATLILVKKSYNSNINSLQNTPELPKNNPDTFSSSQSVIFIALGLVIAIVLILSTLFLIGSKKAKLYVNNSNQTGSRETNVSSRCPSYGLLDKDFYLNKYTVKKGDTLLLIAKYELGDSSRVDELIEINKTWYPSLSIQAPNIEVGWQLRIPPKFFPKSSGFIIGEGGKVLRDREDSMLINLKSDQRIETLISKTPQIKYLGSSSFKQGDCVYVIGDASARAGAGILVISSQDKNYFKDTTSEIKTSERTKGKCSFYGYLDRDSFLIKYIVQKGDTVSSIAQNKLGDAARMEELIHLNNPWYPHLSIQRPFIEIGWELRLPPRIFPKSSGFLVGSGGEILKETDKWISISLAKTKTIPEEWKQPGMEYGHIADKNPRTKYLGQDNFGVGECVYIIEDTGANENYMIAISPQDKNYFKN